MDRRTRCYSKDRAMQNVARVKKNQYDVHFTVL